MLAKVVLLVRIKAVYRIYQIRSFLPIYIDSLIQYGFPDYVFVPAQERPRLPATQTPSSFLAQKL